MQKRGMTLVFGDRQDPVFERLLRTSIKQLPSPDDHRGETKESGNSKFNPAEQNVVGTGLSTMWVLEVRRFANPAAWKYQGPFFSLATLKNQWEGNINVGRWARFPPNSDLYQHRTHCPQSPAPPPHKHIHCPQSSHTHTYTLAPRTDTHSSLGWLTPKKVKTQIPRPHTC